MSGSEYDHTLKFVYGQDVIGEDDVCLTGSNNMEHNVYPARCDEKHHGTGRHRAQIAHFFRTQIGSRTRSGLGLVMGSRLHRKRRRCGSLELPEGCESKPWPITAKVVRTAERIRPKMIEAAAHAV